MRSKRLRRLCRCAQPQARQRSRAPQASSSAARRPIQPPAHGTSPALSASTHTARTSKPTAATSTPNPPQGWSPCGPGGEKKGSMRCATVTKTSTAKPHKAVSTKWRAHPHSPSQVQAASPATQQPPTTNARPTRRACNWSAARLCASRRQNSTVIQAIPAHAPVAPAPAATRLCGAPNSQASHPAASSSKGARRALTGQGATCSHLGPAVNRKPEKKSGKNPHTISAACTTAGGTAPATGTACTRRPSCTPAHHHAEPASSASARKKASRWGASSRWRRRQRRSGAACLGAADSGAADSGAAGSGAAGSGAAEKGDIGLAGPGPAAMRREG